MSRTVRILLLMMSVLILAVYFSGCTTTEKKAGIKAPAEEPAAIQRRAFEGAPPLIPHEVEVGMECLECHRLGDNDAVITSHPERVNCVQCHIPQNTDIKPFVENTF